MQPPAPWEKAGPEKAAIKARVDTERSGLFIIASLKSREKTTRSEVTLACQIGVHDLSQVTGFPHKKPDSHKRAANGNLIRFVQPPTFQQHTPRRKTPRAFGWRSVRANPHLQPPLRPQAYERCASDGTTLNSSESPGRCDDRCPATPTRKRNSVSLRSRRLGPRRPHRRPRFPPRLTPNHRPILQ